MFHRHGGAIYFQESATLVCMTMWIRGKECHFELDLCCARGPASYCKFLEIRDTKNIQ